jgi:hypothetical protein
MHDQNNYILLHMFLYILTLLQSLLAHASVEVQQSSSAHTAADVSELVLPDKVLLV